MPRRKLCKIAHQAPGKVETHRRATRERVRVACNPWRRSALSLQSQTNFCLNRNRGKSRASQKNSHRSRGRGRHRLRASGDECAGCRPSRWSWRRGADRPLPDMGGGHGHGWPRPWRKWIRAGYARSGRKRSGSATPVAVVLSSAPAAAVTTAAADRSTIMPRSTTAALGGYDYGYSGCPGYGVPIVGAVINSVLGGYGGY